MVRLDGPSRKSVSGKVDSLIIFLHGYGADGNDLLSLAEPFSEFLPNTEFIAPNAPNKCELSPNGFQWFPISQVGGNLDLSAGNQMISALKSLDNWLDDTIKVTKVRATRVILVGFSQGTMMSLQIAPRRLIPLGGVIGFSGMTLFPESLKLEVKSKSPILLVHGDIDEVVPVTSSYDSNQIFKDNGFDISLHISRGVGHGIAPDGISQAVQFAKGVLL